MKYGPAALHAYYVIWADVYGPMGHEPVPFATHAAAQKFLKEHKGRKIIRVEPPPTGAEGSH